MREKRGAMILRGTAVFCASEMGEILAERVRKVRATEVMIYNAESVLISPMVTYDVFFRPVASSIWDSILTSMRGDRIARSGSACPLRTISETAMHSVQWNRQRHLLGLPL